MQPTKIILHQQSHKLEIGFDDGTEFHLPAEYLRIFAPSADVGGRRETGRILVTGKSNVAITEVKMVGHYAIKLCFDDGHHHGIYDWKYLHDLGTHQQKNWHDHLARLSAQEG